MYVVNAVAERFKSGIAARAIEYFKDIAFSQESEKAQKAYSYLVEWNRGGKHPTTINDDILHDISCSIIASRESTAKSVELFLASFEKNPLLNAGYLWRCWEKAHQRDTIDDDQNYDEVMRNVVSRLATKARQPSFLKSDDTRLQVRGLFERAVNACIIGTEILSVLDYAEEAEDLRNKTKHNQLLGADLYSELTA